MPEEAVSVVSPLWALLAMVLLLGFALLAAMLQAALTARADGSAGSAARPVGEFARLMRQRRRSTVSADSLLWRVGGAGLLVVAAAMVSVVPLGAWTLSDLDLGVMWFNTMDVMIWAAVWCAGWGANSAHSLIGGYRFLAQALAYELPLMFALLGPAIAASSLNVGEVAAAQAGLWYVVTMPVAFVAFCLSVLAFSLCGPFATAVGADLAGGATAELSGVDRLLFQLGRYALLAAGAAFAVPLFLGGGAGPLLPDWGWVLLKTAALLAALVWVRDRMPVVRPDLFMEIGWLVLLPAVLAQDLLVAVVAAWRS